MSLRRQGSHYIAIGGLQWLLDWGVTVWLSHLGMLIEPANVTGRISGALLGYWLNGKLTFAGEGTALGRTQLGVGRGDRRRDRRSRRERAHGGRADFRQPEALTDAIPFRPVSKYILPKI